MNIYDVAREAGVSPATVSRVINNKGNVKESTRDKVLKVIQGVDYKPNPIARDLSMGESRNVAFLVPDIENSFFAKILHGISDCAIDKDYNVFMYGTDDDLEREHKILDNLRTGMIRGLIITPISGKDKGTLKRLKCFEEEGIPVVLVDRDMKDYKFDGVFSNDVEGAYEVVECLLKEGHNKIGIITGPEVSKPGHDRYEGYIKALKDNQIKVQDKYIARGDFKEEVSYQAMKKLMEQEDPPTAVFTSNNMTTLGCLRYMQEKGLRLKKDVSLVCFDKIQELEYGNIFLTSVLRPVYDMGYEAMHILEKRFEDKEKMGNGRYIIRRHSVNTWIEKQGSEKRE